MGVLDHDMSEKTCSEIIDLYERCETGEGNVFTCALCQAMIAPYTCAGCPVMFDHLADLF